MFENIKGGNWNKAFNTSRKRTLMVVRALMLIVGIIMMVIFTNSIDGKEFKSEILAVGIGTSLYLSMNTFLRYLISCKE